MKRRHITLVISPRIKQRMDGLAEDLGLAKSEIVRRGLIVELARLERLRCKNDVKRV